MAHINFYLDEDKYILLKTKLRSEGRKINEVMKELCDSYIKQKDV